MRFSEPEFAAIDAAQQSGGGTRSAASLIVALTRTVYGRRRIPSVRSSIMRRLRLSAAALTISISTFAIGLPASADAKVTRLELASKQSYGTFRAGGFVLWEGRVTGELRPSEKIPDLDKAPKNANGMAEYSAKISLIFPRN